MTLKEYIKSRWLQPLGMDLIQFKPGHSPLAQYLHLIRYHQIDWVLDVGANAGQFGEMLRRHRFAGHILSFEPQPDAYQQLAAAAAADPRWEALPLALGRAAGEATIHVAGNSQSSSLLPMLAQHETSDPSSGYTHTETIQVARLDALFDEHVPPEARVLLKIDTQGFEQEVLAGAEGCLDRILGVELELSLVPLYEGAPLLPELVTYMQARGFTLMAVKSAFTDPNSGQMLQADGLFFRQPDHA